ncbi:hypothetical protein [Polynucleobacter sp. AP-Latsch-80-C2]|jgi:hypothetical protein|uniref:hypothetical protein n=1 Tax=Polynucleobacter sp. AP-Latsch-80-C2 TaxID=2576931 RepID=UPI001C0E467B|nr:hypothetical protein [Polynucleobacter sp. AP-Latsch-80-C2]MBU3622270.1 hypothetical protein [Polynucleobacter sp. AP-Latsch-80-C2]
MIDWMQNFALIEMAITCGVILVWFAQAFSDKPLSYPVKWCLLILLANLFFWPFGLGTALPLAAYVRGIVGDLSVVLTLLLWSSVMLPSRPIPLSFKFSVTLISLIFYPLALGLGMFDPYSWGYGSLGMLIAVLLFALVLALLGWTKGVWIIALAIIAWAGHWHESTNLWDYVLDPLLGIWAVIALVNILHRKRRDKARSGYLFRPG